MNDDFKNRLKVILDNIHLKKEEENLSEYELNERLFEFSLIDAIINKKVKLDVSFMSSYLNSPPNKIIKSLKRFSLWSKNQKNRIIYCRYRVADILALLNFDANIQNKLPDFNDYKLKSFLKDEKHHFFYRIVFIGLVLSSNLNIPIEMKQILKEIAPYISPGKSKYVLNEIYENFFEIHKDLKSETNSSVKKETLESDVVEDDSEYEIKTEELINKEESEVSKLTTNDLLKTIEKLKEKINELESSNEFLLLKNENIRSEIRELKSEGKINAEIELFRDFNKIENNNILNSFFKANFVWNQLRNSNWKPNRVELSGVLFFFQQLEEFFKRRGLSTRYNLGEILQIRLNEIKLFDYMGSEFISEEDVKKVKIKSPAWYYKDILISKAEVVEINDKEGNNDRR